MISGYFFVTYNILYSNSDLGVMLENTMLAFIFLIPMLTMGMFAGEKRSGTYKLLYSVPVEKYKIVLGKYFAACTVFVTAVMINFLSALTMLFFRGQTFGEVVCIYIGFILIGAAFAAIGMFISSLTENQIVSAVIAFGICFLIYLSEWALDTKLGGIIKWFALTQSFKNFSAGILDLKALIQYISFSAVFVILTILRLEKYEFGGKKRSEQIIIAVCTLASFFVLNYTAELLSGHIQMTYDMTENGIFELSDETKVYLKNIDDDINIYYLTETGNESIYITEVLSRYERQCSRISVENIDIIKNPSFTAKYSSEGAEIEKGSLLIESAKRFTTVNTGSSLFVQRENNGELSRILGFSLESKLTQAIDFVLQEKDVRAAVITNHGEAKFNKAAAVLMSENIQIKNSDSIAKSIGESELIIICAPARDISEDEYNLLSEYLQNGGSVFIALNPGFETDKLKKLCADMGMEMKDTVLTVENTLNIIQNNRMYLLANAVDNNITTGTDFSKKVLFPVASPIICSDNYARTVTPLVITEKETTERVLETDRLGDKSSTGSFIVSAISEDKTTGSKLILSSTSQYIIPEDKNLGDLLNAYNYSNKEVFIKSVKYAVGSKDTTIAAPKNIMSRSLNITFGIQVLLIAIFGIAIPLAVFVMGFAVFLRRRNR